MIILTFSEGFLHGDLMMSDGEGPADEVPTDSTGSSSTSRARTDTNQLPPRVEELLHAEILD